MAADITHRMGLGRAGYVGALPGASDALVLVLLQTTGLETDDALRDHPTLLALLAGSTNECTATNYTRKIITSGTSVTYDGVTNRIDCFFPAQTITNLGTSSQLQQVQKLLVCYWPVNGTGGDSAIEPLASCDYFHVCDGTSFVLDMPNGFYRDAG